MQRFADDVLADRGPVRICGIDEIDTKLDRTAHDGHAFVTVDRLTPDTGSGQSHRAEPEPVDGPLANSERSRRVGGKRGRQGRSHHCVTPGLL